MYGEYTFIKDYYCNALYTPTLKAYADSYRKAWYQFSWYQVTRQLTMEVSCKINNPDGTTSNEYSYTTHPSTWRIQYAKSFPQLNSQGYSSMFSVTNFYARSTMNGGSSGGAVTISH